MVDWKKDISFGRKSKLEGDLEPEPVQGETEPEPQAEKTSFWKKDVSLGRKPKAESDSEPAAEKTSIWKKELSLGRKTKADDDEPPVLEEEAALQAALAALSHQAAQEHAEAAPIELPPLPEPEPELPPAAEARPEAELAAEPEPVLPPAAEALPEGEESADERPPLHPVSWVDAVLHASAAEEGDPTMLPPQALEPVSMPAAEATPVVPTAGVDAPSQGLVSHEVVAAQPVVPLSAPVAAPPVVHPPVPEAELPVIPAEPKLPFWKKEIGSSRKKPKEPKEPKQAKEPKAEGAATPFWKKELGGSRKKKKAGAAVATAAVAVAADPAVAHGKAKTPFWKLELGGSKKKKKQQKDEPAAAEPTGAGSKKPLKKRGRGFSLPRLELQSRRGTQRHKELVGLKIGASQIAAARVSNNGVSEVMQVAREEIDPGIVVGGELRDPEALAVALKEFFRVNKLPRKGIRLGIANNRIGVRTFEITGIEDPKQLANAIRFRAQEALPIPIEEAVLDYHVLSETTNEEGETVRKILLVVAYRELVDRYISACRDAGLSLAGIDLEAFALLRSLAAPREDEGPAAAALVAVAVGHDRSTFAVSDGRVCEFTRVLDWGGSTLSVAIARALDMTPSETEPIKRALSLEPGPAPEGISEEVAAAAREAVKAQINNFARELVSSLQFYQNQPGSLGIGEIVLTGGTAHLPGFAAELQRLIGVRVKIGDPLVRVKVGRRVEDPEQLGSLAIAIGLGIED